jgi:hypothetical protein
MGKLQTALITGLMAIGIQSAAYSADSANSTQLPQNQKATTSPLGQSDRPASAAGTQSQDTGNQTGPSSQTNQQGRPTERPASAARDNPKSANQDEEYQAKLKKCDGMSNAGAQKKCAEKVKKEHGQM